MFIVPGSGDDVIIWVFLMDGFSLSENLLEFPIAQIGT